MQVTGVAQDFYPFVDNGNGDAGDISQVRHPARIAVYDDASAAPRVVVVEPKDVRSYLEEITLQVTQLSAAQGGTIPFMVIREIVENFIHAYFIEPTISILDHGNTIRFSDQGPGIPQKERALQYGTTSATEDMRRYIRGVGSGLPYVQQYMLDKGGSLEIDDNIAGGTVVTLSTKPNMQPSFASAPQAPAGYAPVQQVPQQMWQQPTWLQVPQQGWAQQPPWPQQQFQPTYQQGFSQPYPPLAQQPTQSPNQQMPQQGTLSWPAISPRARIVLDYLSSHDSVGPSDLARVYGESQPTWTRELQALEEEGLIRKDGQKRRLTAMGRSFLTS